MEKENFDLEKMNVEVFSLENSQFKSSELSFLKHQHSLDLENNNIYKITPVSSEELRQHIDNRNDILDTTSYSFVEKPHNEAEEISHKFQEFSNDIDQIFADFDREVSQIFTYSEPKTTSNIITDSEDTHAESSKINLEIEKTLISDNIIDEQSASSLELSDNIINEQPASSLELSDNIIDEQPASSLELSDNIIDEQPASSLELSDNIIDEQPASSLELSDNIIDEQPASTLEHSDNIIDEQPASSLELSDNIIDEQPISITEENIPNDTTLEYSTQQNTDENFEILEEISIDDIILNDMCDEEDKILDGIADETPETSLISSTLLQQLNNSIPTNFVSNSFTELSKQEICEIMKEIDTMLEFLPDEKIEELATKEFYHNYIKFLDDLGI